MHTKIPLTDRSLPKKLESVNGISCHMISAMISPTVPVPPVAVTRLGGIEPPHLPPEGSALSPELQTYIGNYDIILSDDCKEEKRFLPTF